MQAGSGSSFDVTNPATGAKLTSVPNCDVKDAEKAVAAARKAFQTWGFDTTAKERAALLQKWFNILIQRQEELGQILTAEQVSFRSVLSIICDFYALLKLRMAGIA